MVASVVSVFWEVVMVKEGNLQQLRLPYQKLETGRNGSDEGCTKRKKKFQKIRWQQ